VQSRPGLSCLPPSGQESGGGSSYSIKRPGTIAGHGRLRPAGQPELAFFCRLPVQVVFSIDGMGRDLNRA